MAPQRTAIRPELTTADILYEVEVMRRWCRLFRRRPEDWVQIEAERFRARYPLSPVSRLAESSQAA